ncbi:MAG: hypothetical protein R2836_08290 [Chitinophagales bacterium]
MKIFITGKGINAATGNGTQELALPNSTHTWLEAQKPDFNKYFDAKDARRTSHILKISSVAAFDALGDDKENIDGIMVGTGIGCITDSEKFLISLVEFNESTLSPTPFIQSTHNTIAGNIALKLKIHQYNFTYSERIFSFEWTLLDAILQCHENDGNKRFLVGSADELNEKTFEIAKALNLAIDYNAENAEILNNKHKAPYLGEHAAFFTLSNNSNTQHFGELVFVKTYFQQNNNQKLNDIVSLLKQSNVQQPDCIILGINGHKVYDKIYDNFTAHFNKSQLAYYKHLCGESFTSSSYAFWLATEILEKAELPKVATIKSNENPIKNVLILNHFRRDYFSAIFIKK